MEIIILLLLLLFGIPASSATPPPPTVSAMDTAVFYANNSTPDQLQAAADVLTTRLHALGIDSTATVDPVEPFTITVALPQSNDPARLINLLTRPAYLELVDFSSVQHPGDYIGKRIIWTTGQAARTIQGSYAELDPQTGQPFPTILDGAAVIEASASEASGQWLVQITLNDTGKTALAQFTRDHIGKALAIVVDGLVISAPIINAEISGGQAVIAGNFTEQEAHDLAAQIESQPLPISLQLSYLG
jgi:preprotein translocase subunit SecD